jgi:hypothetical protein
MLLYVMESLQPIQAAYDGDTLDWVAAPEDRVNISIEKAYVLDAPKLWLKEKYNTNITKKVQLIHHPRSGTKYGLPEPECYYIKLPRGSMKKYKIPAYDPRCDTMFTEKSFFNSEKSKNMANIQKVSYHIAIENNKLSNKDLYAASVKILSYRFGLNMKDKKILDHLKDYEKFFGRSIFIFTVINCEDHAELLNYTKNLKQMNWNKKKGVMKKLRKLKSSYVVSPALILTGLIARPYIPPPAWLVAYPFILIATFAYPAIRFLYRSYKFRGKKVLRTY